MLKKLTLLALAAVSMSAFAQDSTTTTTTTVTTSNTAIMPAGMDYNMNATSQYDRWHQVQNLLTWLGGGDQYYFQKQFDMATGPEQFAITQALYNLGGWAAQLRWENGVARINQEWPTYAKWGNTTIASTTTTDTTANTTTTTTTTWTAPTTVYTWDTNSATARPLRFVYEMQRPRVIDYRTAAEVLTSGLGPTEAGVFNHWWLNSDERSKDIMVRLINRQLEWVDTTPLRVYYLSSYHVMP